MRLENSQNRCNPVAGAEPGRTRAGNCQTASSARRCPGWTKPGYRLGSAPATAFGAMMALAVLLSMHGAPTSAAELKFRTEELPERLEVGYAVTVADMNDDAKLDVVVVDTERVIWLENPSWKVHAVIQGQTKRDNVCIAPYDIDGDGKVDLALGADWRPIDTRTGGTIQWLGRTASADGRWQVHPIGEEPTVHRMRWADLDGDGRKELIVMPMMGRDSTKPLWMEHPLRVLAYEIPRDPAAAWRPRVLNEELHVAHNFWPTDLDHDGKTDLLVASFEGVTLLRRGADGRWTSRRIGAGNQDNPEARGASEIKHGTLAGGGDYIATIEPWHGYQVVVYTRPLVAGDEGMWDRHVIDSDLKWGHAVWCANLDGDDDHELIIGVRDDKESAGRCGLRIYDAQDKHGSKWRRTIVDPGGVNIEDVTAADFDGDGRTDIVAVGRQSHNIRIYWNETE